jgi:predicted nucleic-acid-binding protein
MRWQPVKPERVFADTNLFLRYLTNDVPEQADSVERILQMAAEDQVVLVVNGLIVAEIVWTLESFYRLTRVSIAEKVRAILNTPGIEVTDGDLVLQAVADYADKNVDFIDAYNGAWLLAQGMSVALTFDQLHFSRLDGVTARVPGHNPA